MTAYMQFVELDGKAHVLAEGGVRTVCYLEVPFNSDWTQGEVPKGLCSECAKKAGVDKKADGLVTSEGDVVQPEPESEIVAGEVGPSTAKAGKSGSKT